MFYGKNKQKKKKLSRRVWDTNRWNLQWRELPSFPDGFIRDSGSCDGEFRKTQERSSREWHLHFPLLSSGLPPAASWNILEYSAPDKPEEQQETAQGRRWLWLFHFRRAGFGDGKWQFWRLGRINWLWSNPGFAGKATSPGGVGTQGLTLVPWGPHHLYPLPQALHFTS